MSVCISTCDAALVRRLVVLTQSGLPLVPDPWAWLGKHLDMSPGNTLALVQQLQADGIIRRVAAIPDHCRLGYLHNGMTVWDVADTHVDRMGACLGRLTFISHCYRRPRRPDWPYNLFAMIHGRGAAEIDAQRDIIRAILGATCRNDDILVSSQILKKANQQLAQSAEEKYIC